MDDDEDVTEQLCSIGPPAKSQPLCLGNFSKVVAKGLACQLQASWKQLVQHLVVGQK